MNNLKSCPFCGGIAELNAPGYEYYSPCWCKCTRCGAEGPTKSSELEAEKGWNERVQDKQEAKSPHYTRLEYLVNCKVVKINHPECPRCFENGLDLWSAEIEKGQAYCKRCGQKVVWDND